ncbi:MAG: type IV toxin-antitoxin system AbiEi family antitoxin domain-containing protein, partial [Acidimicrobiia bacterium]
MEATYALAAQQLGLVTRDQLRTSGITRNRLKRLIERGQLTALQPKVFALPGSVDTPHRDLLAKILETGADATASHSTAAWLWGIGGYSKTPVHVVVTRHQRHHQHLSWTVHQFTGLPPHHRRTLDAIPVTSPALTMLHLAQIVSARRLAIAV